MVQKWSKIHRLNTTQNLSKLHPSVDITAIRSRSNKKKNKQSNKLYFIGFDQNICSVCVDSYSTLKFRLNASKTRILILSHTAVELLAKVSYYSTTLRVIFTKFCWEDMLGRSPKMMYTNFQLNGSFSCRVIMFFCLFVLVPPIGGIVQNLLCILRVSCCLSVSSFIKLGHFFQQL